MGIVLTLAALMLLSAGTAYIALGTEWGARVLWQAASRLAPGQLTANFSGGTLASGITLRNVRYRNDTTSVRIDEIASQWRIELTPATLIVQFLRAGTVEVSTRPSDEPDKAATMPRRIALPLAIDLQSATIRQVIVGEDDGASRYRDIRVRGKTDGMHHELTLEHAGTPYGDAVGSFRMGGTAPFRVDGAAELNGKYGERDFRLAARLSGTLANLGLAVDAAAATMQGSARIEATPFAPVPLRSANITVEDLDPHAIRPEWPKADLSLRARLGPADPSRKLSPLAVGGTFSLRNSLAGALDKERLPLVSASGGVTLDRQRQALSGVRIKLAGDAALEGGGEVAGGRGKFSLQARDLDLHALHSALVRTDLDGPIAMTLDGKVQHVNAELADGSRSIATQATLTPEKIELHSATLQAKGAKLAMSGTLGRDETSAYAVEGRVTDFDPALFLASARAAPAKGRTRAKVHRPDADINARFDAQGTLKPELTAAVKFNVQDSTYDGLPMTGGGSVRIEGKRLVSSDVALAIASNKLELEGSLGRPSDRLRIDVDAPALGRLGFGLSGSLHIRGQLGGTLKQPYSNLEYRATRLSFGRHRAALLFGTVRALGVPGNQVNAEIRLDLHVRDASSGALRIAKGDLDVDGNYADHTLTADATGSLRGRPLDVTLSASGRLRDRPQGMSWNGRLLTLENRSAPRISLASPLPVSLAPGRVELGAARLNIAKASIALDNFRYGAGSIASKGAFDALDVGHLLALRRQFTGSAAPFETDLVLDGRWNFTVADRAEGFIRIARRSGDIRTPGGTRLGLENLSLRAGFRNNIVEIDGNAAASRIGTATADIRVVMQSSGGRLAWTPEAPLSGRINASIPRLQTISALAGPSIALGGSADLALTLGGTLGDPALSGMVEGNRLTLTLYDQGVRLHDGTARIRLDNDVAELQRLEFSGGEGTLRATGRIPLDRIDRELKATVVADNLQLLSSPSRQMTVSGSATASNADGRLRIGGKFTVDRARFSMPDKPAPELDDDVVVIRGGRRAEGGPGESPAERRAGPFAPVANILVDLGDDFRFEGAGAELRLAGTLTLQTTPGEPLQAIGTVRVVEGSYEAFGTELAIERGILNFQGPLTNPNINILAMRRSQEVSAGVRITGTVQQPRARLISEPPVSEEETLSWLVFGRAGGSDEPGQAQAATKGAAFGLLNKFGGEKVAEQFGLDEFSIGKSASGLSGVQVVNLGKEISDRLYIGFEQSLAGAESVLKLTYQLSRYWSVILRGGDVTGIDMSYSRRFDRIS